MTEQHKMTVSADSGDFEVEALVDEDGSVEVVFSRHDKPAFRVCVADLGEALEFVEKHAEVTFVERDAVVANQSDRPA